MNGVKNFAIAFCISLVIFGLLAFIIVQFMWPSASSAHPAVPTDFSEQTIETGDTI